MQRSFTSRGLALALVALSALGLGLRVSGLEHLLPHRPEMDAHNVTQIQAYLEEGGWSSDDPRRVNAYPTLLARLALLAPFPPPAGAAGEPADLAQHRAAAAVHYVRLRLVVALAAAALVLATFSLARHFAGPWTALLAAAFVAFDPLQILFALQARGHGFVPVFMLLAVLAALRLRRRPTVPSYALAGVAGAIAVGSIHSGLAVLPPLLYAHLARERGGGSRARFLGPLCMLGLVAAGFFYFYADILAALRYQGLVDGEQEAVVQGGHVITREMFNGAGFAAMKNIFLGSNPVLAVLALGGAVLLLIEALWDRSRLRLASDWGVVLAFVLPYGLALGLYVRTYERFTLPLHPYMALAAALLLARIARSVVRPAAGPLVRSLPLVGALAVLAFPAYCGVKLAWLRARPDTFELAARYLDEHVPPDSVVMLAPGADLPRFYAPRSLVRADGTPVPIRRLWIEYQQSLPPEHRRGREYAFEVLTYGRREVWHESPGSMARLLRESPACYALLADTGSVRPEERHFLEAAEDWGTLEASFPTGTGRLQPPPFLNYGFNDGFLADLLDARALGIELLLYRRGPNAD